MPLSPDLERDLQDCLENEASRYCECLDLTIMQLRHHIAEQGWVDQTELSRRASGRPKKLRDIETKVDRHGPRDVASFEELEELICDIVGARVILDHPYQAEEMVRWIKEESGWEIRDIQDSIRDTGYRSVHVDVARDTTHHKCVPCEIQVRTILQHAWATWSHPFYERYRSDLNAIPPLVRDLMKQLSQMLDACDNMAQDLHYHALRVMEES